MSSQRRRGIIIEHFTQQFIDLYDLWFVKISQALPDTSAERKKNICRKVHRGQGVEAFKEFLCQGWIYRSHRRTKDLGAIEALVHHICIESHNHRASFQWERRTVINFIPHQKMGKHDELMMNSPIFQMPTRCNSVEVCKCLRNKLCSWRSGHLWNVLFQNDQLSSRERNTVACHISPTEPIFSNATVVKAPKLPDAQQKTDFSWHWEPAMLGEVTPPEGENTLMEWHPAAFPLWLIFFIETLKHYHRKDQSFVEDHMEEKNHGPKKFNFKGFSVKFYLVRFAIPIST